MAFLVSHPPMRAATSGLGRHAGSWTRPPFSPLCMHVCSDRCRREPGRASLHSHRAPCMLALVLAPIDTVDACWPTHRQQAERKNMWRSLAAYLLGGEPACAWTSCHLRHPSQSGACLGATLGCRLQLLQPALDLGSARGRRTAHGPLRCGDRLVCFLQLPLRALPGLRMWWHSGLHCD